MPLGDVDVLGVRMLLTVECVTTTACVVLWIVVIVVLTAMCGAEVRAEGRCGCAGSADDADCGVCDDDSVRWDVGCGGCCADNSVWCSRMCRGEMWMCWECGCC